MHRSQEEIQYNIRKWLDKVKNNDISSLFTCPPEDEIDEYISKGKSMDPYADFSGVTQYQYMFNWDGRKDPKGRVSGSGTVKFHNGDEISAFFRQGLREGKGSVCTTDVSIIGEFKSNQLCGLAKVVRDKYSTEGYLINGRFHGLIRRHDSEKNLKAFGKYCNGKAIGIWWKMLEGGGVLVGNVNRHEKFSGNETIFLYPDLITCFVGWFEDEKMVNAKIGNVTGFTIEDGIMVLDVEYQTQKHGFGQESLKYESLCSFPTERDPYEAKTVECKSSLVVGAGQGVFVKRDIPMGTVVAFYNGIRIPAEEDDGDDSWEDCAYR